MESTGLNTDPRGTRVNNLTHPNATALVNTLPFEKQPVLIYLITFSLISYSPIFAQKHILKTP